MMFMVPSQEKHQEVAKEKLVALVEEKVSTIEGAKEIIEGNNVDTNILIDLVMKNLKMKDYLVCNVGMINYDGKDYPITIGLFNHVFVTTDYIDDIQRISKRAEEIRNTISN